MGPDAGEVNLSLLITSHLLSDACDMRQKPIIDTLRKVLEQSEDLSLEDRQATIAQIQEIQKLENLLAEKKRKLEKLLNSMKDIVPQIKLRLVCLSFIIISYICYWIWYPEPPRLTWTKLVFSGFTMFLLFLFELACTIDLKYDENIDTEVIISDNSNMKLSDLKKRQFQLIQVFSETVEPLQRRVIYTQNWEGALLLVLLVLLSSYSLGRMCYSFWLMFDPIQRDFEGNNVIFFVVLFCLSTGSVYFGIVYLVKVLMKTYHF